MWGESRLEAGRGLPLPVPVVSVTRPGLASPGAAIVCVGGATLGGSGKTPLVAALARALAARGVSVAVVGHGHRARLGRAAGARRVTADDDPRAVGDEALLLARSLGQDIPVVIADRRVDAMATASARAGLVLVDGPLALRPRAAASVLAVDARAPWGSGRVAPRGDLRAAPEALVAAADHVVALAAPGDDLHPDLAALGERVTVARWSEPEIVVDDRTVPAAELAGERLGLATALGRPARIVRMVARLGLAPIVHVRAPDHGPRSDHALLRATATHDVERWIVTEKCALSLQGALARTAGKTPAIVRSALDVDAQTVRALATLAALTVPARAP